MMGAIKYCLSHLTDFSGRDARSTFWYYVIFLVVVGFLVSMVASIPATVGMMQGAMDAATSGADEEAIRAAMTEQMVPMMKQQIYISTGVSLVMMLLFVAAFARRVHDTGNTGWIALVPVLTTVIPQVHAFMIIDELAEATRVLMQSETPNPGAAMAMAGTGWNLVPWIGYLVVIVFGVMGTQHGANKYGEEPPVF